MDPTAESSIPSVSFNKDDGVASAIFALSIDTRHFKPAYLMAAGRPDTFKAKTYVTLGRASTGH